MNGSPHVWRPSMSRYVGYARTGMVVVGVVSVAEVALLLFWRTGALAALPAAVAVVVPGATALTSQVVRIRRTTLSVDDALLRWRGVFTTVSMRRSEVQGVLAPIKRPKTVPTTMLLLTDGRSHVRLVGGLWDEADLHEIAATLSLQSSVQGLDLREVEAQAPGATTVFGRHPWRTSLGIAALILLATTLTAVVLVLDYHPASSPRGPARVSPRTAASQARELGQLQKVLGTTAWSSPGVRLWSCDDDDGRPGWQRHVETETSRSAEPSETEVRRVETLLRSDGYDVSRSKEADGGVTVDGERDTATDAADVEIDVIGHEAAMNLTGACET